MNNRTAGYILLGTLGAAALSSGFMHYPVSSPEARQHMAREAAVVLAVRGAPIDVNQGTSHYRISNVQGRSPTKLHFGEALEVQIASTDGKFSIESYGGKLLCRVDLDGRTRLYAGNESECDTVLQQFYRDFEIAKAKAEGAVGIRLSPDELNHAAHGSLTKKKREKVQGTLDNILKKFMPRKVVVSEEEHIPYSPIF